MSNARTNNGHGTALQSVDRAISVLEILAKNGDSGVTEIAADLDVHKSTASRLVSALADRGLVEQRGNRGRYAIGIGVVRLAGAAIGRFDLSRLGAPVCEDMAETLGETVNIAVYDAGAVTNIIQAHGSAAISAQNWIGRRTPLHATSSGKVLLAALPEAERDDVLAEPLEEYTEQTIVDRTALAAELDRITSRGYSSCFEEYEIGMNAVAVPIYNSAGAVAAAMSASGPAYRLSRRSVTEIVEELQRAAGELSATLGYLDG